MDLREFHVGRRADVNLDTHDCVAWPLHVMASSYGAKTDRSRVPRMMPAHRWVYEKVVGPIPTGLHLDHRRRRRDCVNPRHATEIIVAKWGSDRGDEMRRQAQFLGYRSAIDHVLALRDIESTLIAAGLARWTPHDTSTAEATDLVRTFMVRGLIRAQAETGDRATYWVPR